MADSVFLTPIRHYAPEDKTLIFFMIASSQLAELESGAREAGGIVTHSGVYPGLNARPLLSDYTWNHTTLWAIEIGRRLYLFANAARPRYCARTDAPITGEIRTGVSVPHGIYETRRWPRVPGRDSVVYYTTEERTERDDRFLPRNLECGWPIRM